MIFGPKTALGRGMSKKPKYVNYALTISQVLIKSKYKHPFKKKVKEIVFKTTSEEFRSLVDFGSTSGRNTFKNPDETSSETSSSTIHKIPLSNAKVSKSDDVKPTPFVAQIYLKNSKVFATSKYNIVSNSTCKYYPQLKMLLVSFITITLNFL